MKKFLAILSALLLMILAVVPMASASADSTMYINSSNGGTVNVRALPDKDSGTVLVKLGVGFPVTVKNYSSDWSYVSVKVAGKTINGYVMTQFLQGSDPSNAAQSFTNVSKTYTVTVRGTSKPGKVFLRPSAVKSGEVRSMTNGEKLTVLAASHAWYKVRDAYGNVGYVVKAFVRK